MTALPHPVPTPTDRNGMRAALAMGHFFQFGFAPSLERLTMGLAQCCLEEANGKALAGFDYGNLDVGKPGDWQGDTFPLLQGEVFKGRRVEIVKLMRSYPTAAEGGAGYWKLAAEPRFVHDNRTALDYFDAGDPVGASAALKAGGWFTATLASYTHEMVQLYAECLRVT